MEDGLEPEKKSRWVVVLLWLVPVWLIFSAGAGIWMYFDAQKAKARKEEARFAAEVSQASLASDREKLTKVIGARNPAVEGGKGLTQAAAWIEGNLGPSNTGYVIKRVSGPHQWPLIEADLNGSREKSPAVWVVTSYDSAAPDGKEADPDSDPAAAVASLLATAKALAGEKPVCDVHFVFVPHAHGEEGDAAATRDRLVSMVKDHGSPATLLFLWGMGNGAVLDVSTRDTSNPVFAVVPAALGKVRAPSPDQASSEALFSLGMPAVRVSSSPADRAAPDDLAKVTGRLVELIRQLASKK